MTGAPAATGVLSRARGCLLGQLAGDSLGSLVEFESAEAIRAAYPGGGPRDLAPGGTWDTLPGQPTDDSELALALARSLVGRTAYSPEAAAAAYAEWYASGPFDIGGTTTQALAPAARALARGESAAEAARGHASPDSQANGALMRVSPLGIFGHGHAPATVAAWARDDAALTHPHPICADANALFAVAVARAVAEGPTPAELHQWVRAWAVDNGLHPDVLTRLDEAAAGPPPDFLRQQGWVLTALHNAFFELLNAETLEEGIVRTVARGGDTDTNGCIAGALLGAVHGADAVPWRWREAILSCRPEAGRPGVRRPRPPVYWPVDALELAAVLVGVGVGESG